MKSTFFTPPIHPTAASLAGPIYREGRRRGFCLDKVHAAIVIASHAHAEQHRLDGTAYFGHVSQVAIVCSSWNCTENTFLAAELHDVLEDAPQYRDAVEVVFGPEVIRLIEIVSKNKSIADRTARVADAQDRLMTSLDQFDLNPIHLKLADRAHNLVSSARLTPEKLARLHDETTSFYVPLARKVGCTRLADWMSLGAMTWQACEREFLHAMSPLGPPNALA